MQVYTHPGASVRMVVRVQLDLVAAYCRPPGACLWVYICIYIHIKAPQIGMFGGSHSPSSEMRDMRASMAEQHKILILHVWTVFGPAWQHASHWVPGMHGLSACCWHTPPWLPGDNLGTVSNRQPTACRWLHQQLAPSRETERV